MNDEASALCDGGNAVWNERIFCAGRQAFQSGGAEAGQTGDGEASGFSETLPESNGKSGGSAGVTTLTSGVAKSTTITTMPFLPSVAMKSR